MKSLAIFIPKDNRELHRGLRKKEVEAKEKQFFKKLKKALKKEQFEEINIYVDNMSSESFKKTLRELNKKINPENIHIYTNGFAILWLEDEFFKLFNKEINIYRNHIGDELNALLMSESGFSMPKKEDLVFISQKLNENGAFINYIVEDIGENESLNEWLVFSKETNASFVTFVLEEEVPSKTIDPFLNGIKLSIENSENYFSTFVKDGIFIRYQKEKVENDIIY